MKMLIGLALACATAFAADIESKVKHGFADSNGVKIHYATMGSGPLVVMIHGFPDYWYSWRAQMEGLADKFQVVAMDQRGYNLSDKPEGRRTTTCACWWAMIAVIRHFGKDKAIWWARLGPERWRGRWPQRATVMGG
jgi:pimeloyl-ACP methyl ester carboxylesterase